MKILTSILGAALLCACAPDAQKPAADANAVADRHEPHVLNRQSAADFETTLAQLRAAIDARGFKTFAVIDHAAGAASVDLTLGPTTLVIFGSPKGGAPAMQAAQAMGLELPLKMLVMEEEAGGVALVWPDMRHTFLEYAIADHPAAEKMSAVLAAVAEEAAR